MKTNNKRTNTLRLVQLAILIALVAVLQIFGSGIKVGTVSLSFVLIPIVFGGMALGPAAGALLGFVFGVITLFAGILGYDGFTMILFQSSIKGAITTSLICLGKGSLAGFGAGLIYKALKNKNALAASFLAAGAAPIINTGLFVIGALTGLSDVIAENFAQGSSVVYFVIIGCAGVNFIVELVINLLVAPGLHRVNTVVNKQK